MMPEGPLKDQRLRDIQTRTDQIRGAAPAGAGGNPNDPAGIR